jgi:hypothetical protein
MADSNTNPQPVVVVQPLPQAPGPTEGMLQPADAKDPNAKPTYMLGDVEVDPDGNPVKGKGK